MLTSSFARGKLAAALAALAFLATAPAPAAHPGAATQLPAQAALLGGTLSGAQIAGSCRVQIARARMRIDAIAHQRGPRSFANVIAAIETVESDLNDNLAAAQFVFQVASDAGVRAASQRCSADVANFLTIVTARPDLYAAMIAARASRTAITPAQRKLQELAIIGAQRSGAGLATPQRRELIALQQQLTDLANSFGADLANDTSTIAITPAQAAVLPADFVTQLKADASGNTIVPVNESTAGTFLANESDGAAREAYYVAFFRRGGELNVALLQRAIVARDRLAHLLHYPNWAAYIAADRMVGSTERTRAFLHGLTVALLPKARAERAQLASAKGSPLDQWDVSYEQNQLRKALYNVDRDAIKQYFPAPHVIAAVMRIYARLLGLTFAPAPNLPRWDPAVLAYTVTDTKTGKPRGSFYLDLYPRPGKFTHFSNVPLYGRRVLADGTVRPALNTILGNWPAPAPGKPSLLSHADVITFFHEFGHNVAALCADTPYETLNDGFRWDFVEAPSQMLENFVWDPLILKQISSNVGTGAPLPDGLIHQMRAARYFDEAYNEDSQAFLATIDQRFHTLAPPVATTAVWKRTLAEVTPNRFVEGTIPQASFGHLMNGYEAQYYGYLWSKVYAQDMFTAFSAGGLENPAVGARYRSDILAPARTIEPDAEVQRFLGRPMRPAAFYRALGITGNP
jgi:thimet oligopeptidase